MTGDRSQLTNFVQKFLGTVKFDNDHIAKIMRYGDYQIGNATILRVYYVEGLGHNLFSVGQFCDSNLEITFRKHTCFVCNLEGVDLLLGSQETNLYTLSIGDMMASSPICLLSKASKTKSWLWHQRLSHLNFGAINHLAKHGLVRGLPKLKFEKDHLCLACAMGKSKKQTHKPKSKDTNQEKLYLLHMDLCGPMHVASINGKKYILVIMDNYSQSTWVKFLASNDEVPDFIIMFLKMIQVRLNATVRNIRTDNGTEFVNQTLCNYYESVGISHETSVARTGNDQIAKIMGYGDYQIVASINGKKYILVIVDGYSRFTWVKFLASKGEAPDFIIKFLKMIQVRLNATVRKIRIDNRTEFVNQTLRTYYESVNISHETSIARTPQQNGVVERRNRTLVEAA
ncbi:retrovirus-related pol polyprotein from transposon TNT 1-94 [Tanacetum coccineum]